MSRFYTSTDKHKETNWLLILKLFVQTISYQETIKKERWDLKTDSFDLHIYVWSLRQRKKYPDFSSIWKSVISKLNLLSNHDFKHTQIYDDLVSVTESPHNSMIHHH